MASRCVTTDHRNTNVLHMRHNRAISLAMTHVNANLKRRCVALYRVSTTRQGLSGLGLEAQQDSVRTFLGEEWKLVEEVVEVASGRQQHREGLDRALSLCRAHNAVLIIARLCRLSRDPILLMLLERSGIEFVAVDMPTANQLTVRLMAVLAAEETRLISERTKASLAMRKERGLPMGGNNPRIGDHAHRAASRSAVVRRAKASSRAADLHPILASLRSEGFNSLAQLASGLNERGVRRPRGGQWSPQAVWNVLQVQQTGDE